MVESGPRRRFSSPPPTLKKLVLLVDTSEAHVIRNRSSKVFQAVSSLKTKHRWCLTGTPIQNYIQDFGSLVEFLRVDSFSNHKDFKKLFVDPISLDDGDGLQRLKRLFQGISLRRTKSSVQQDLKLPTKRHRIEPVELRPDERDLYDMVKKSGAFITSRHRNHNILQIILKLRQISNHGRDLLPADLVNNIDRLRLGTTVDLEGKTCEACSVSIEDGNFERRLESQECAHQICTDCCSMSTKNTLAGTKCPLCFGDGAKGPKKARGRSQPKSTFTGPYKPSSKVQALLRNLEAERVTAKADSSKPRKRCEYMCGVFHPN